MSTFLLGVGVALAIEGLLYAAFPDGMHSMMRRALEVPPSSLRTFGVIALATGVAIVWLVNG